jgi:hypothetical protein
MALSDAGHSGITKTVSEVLDTLRCKNGMTIIGNQIVGSRLRESDVGANLTFE